MAVRPWRGEGRPYNYGISWGEAGSVFGRGGGGGGGGGLSCNHIAVSPFWKGGGGGGGVELLGGGGGVLPLRPPLIDETLLEGIMKNPMEPCTCCCCCITHRR